MPISTAIELVEREIELLENEEAVLRRCLLELRNLQSTPADRVSLTRRRAAKRRTPLRNALEDVLRAFGPSPRKAVIERFRTMKPSHSSASISATLSKLKAEGRVVRDGSLWTLADAKNSRQ